MIYLAGPYSHDDQNIREQRFEALTKKAAQLMIDGHVVFSPITHGHTIAERHELPLSFEWWATQCLGMLNVAERLIILRLDGYVESIGVNAEIRHAEALGIKIEYVNV